MRRLLEDEALSVVVCDLGAVTSPSAATVDALARLCVITRRLGCRMELLHPSRELRGLLSLAGLEEVLPVAEGLPVQALREPEQREQGRGVEEEGDPAEPPA